MQRGFLNRAQAKKAKGKKREAARLQNASAQNASEVSQVSRMKVFDQPITNVEGLLPEYEAVQYKAVETPGEILDYPEDSPYVTSIPGFYGTLEENPDNWAECFFIGPHPKKLVYSQPGFPLPIYRRREPVHRIGSVPGMGTGMFATKDIPEVSLILSERPLIVVPAATLITVKDFHKYSNNEVAQIVGIEWEKQLDLLFQRLLPENQKAFMELVDSHVGHGNGPIGGRIRTNGFHIKKLQHPEKPGKEGAYSGICNELSRVNHSCAPNAFVSFDLKSFSFQLWSRRHIKEGEQIMISYTSVMKPLEERRQELIRYGFECKCEACLDPVGSDEIRRKLLSTAKSVQTVFDMWSVDHTIPYEVVLQQCVPWIYEMIKLGIPYIPPYQDFVKIAYDTIIAAGDEQLVIQVGELWKNCQMIDLPMDEKKAFLEKHSDPEYHLSDPKWATRKRSATAPTPSVTPVGLSELPPAMRDVLRSLASSGRYK